MPVNSFDHYPMSWKPQKNDLTSPIYLCLAIEIATELIESGLDLQIIHEKRELSIQRNQIYQTIFPQENPCLVSYYQWLALPPHCSGRLCEATIPSKSFISACLITIKTSLFMS